MPHRILFRCGFICVVALAAAGGLWLFTPNADAQSGVVARKPAELHFFSLGANALDTALVYLDTKPIMDFPMVFTISFDLDSDGAYSASEVAVDHAAGFSNGSEPTGFPVEFAGAADPAAQFAALHSVVRQVPVKIVLSTLADPLTPVETVETHARRFNIDAGGIAMPSGSLIGRVREWLQIPSVYAQQPGQGGLRQGVPDINGRKGKPNECVPIAVTNSLRWLAQQQGFQGSLPAKDEDLLNQLDTDLGYTSSGVDRNNFMSGKNAFTNRNGLNLDNKRLDAAITDGASNVCALIKQEFDAKEDVELVIDFKPNAQSQIGDVTRSHAVTIVGFRDLGNNKCTITVHDPFSPGKPKTENYAIGRDGKIAHPYSGSTPGFGTLIFSESIRDRT